MDLLDSTDTDLLTRQVEAPTLASDALHPCELEASNELPPQFPGESAALPNLYHVFSKDKRAQLFIDETDTGILCGVCTTHKCETRLDVYEIFGPIPHHKVRNRVR